MVSMGVTAGLSARATAADAAVWAKDLEGKDPDTIIRFATERFGDALAVATQFGVEGCTLLHRVARFHKTAWFFTVDTGLLFHETYALADELEKKLGITIARVRPPDSPAVQAVKHGPNLWERDPDLCCTLRKVQPMLDALTGKGAWMTAVRREQSSTRREVNVVEWDAKFGLPKFSPLATQTADEIARYVDEHQIPTNPLREYGYLSLGCLPCTRPTKSGEDPRAGRWWRNEKTECGIHVAPKK
jgi:phosphoadenosine phosphosulfate reductase